MNRYSDVEDSESIQKCQKSIFYTLIDSVMLTERKRRTSRRRAHNKKKWCVVNVCTVQNSMETTISC